MWVIWFFLKLLGAGIGLLLGLTGKKFRGAEERPYGKETCYVYYSTHKGKIRGRSIGVDHSGPKFRLVKESKWDTRFKDWGLSTELQTGDKKFDDLVYVISDNPLLASHLSLSEETRDKVHDALSAEFYELECDGERLWITARGGAEASDGDLNRIVELSESMDKIKSDPVPMYREPFFYKAFITEAILYSLCGYATVGFLELLVTHETLVLHFNQQIWCGLGLGVALFVTLLSVVRTLFSGSSRGHRIILESTLMLVLTLPMAGILLIEDIDVGLDYHPEMTVTAVVREFEERRHTTKNGHYYTYHAHLEPSDGGEIELPAEISVPEIVYRNRHKGEELQLNLGPGALGLPWIRAFGWKH